MKIIDNYLPKSEYLELKKNIESYDFPWFYNSKVWKLNSSDIKLWDFQFTHIFYIDNKPNSEYLNILQFECKAAIYYINDNNGYTMIGDKKVKSKGNRIVLFNANTKHYGTNSTNLNNRIVINFNYI